MTIRKTRYFFNDMVVFHNTVSSDGSTHVSRISAFNIVWAQVVSSAFDLNNAFISDKIIMISCV